jgi:hypothetical protein
MVLNIGMICAGIIGFLHLRSLKQIRNENRLSDFDINLKIRGVADLKFEYEDGFVGNLISIWNKIRLDERNFEIFFENGYLELDGYNIFSFR